MVSRYSNVILEWLKDHAEDDPLKVVLSKSPFDKVTSQELSAQLIGRKVARNKHPFLLENTHYRYPVKISLEQSSSQATAEYKTHLMTGPTVVDLTGGMGMDSIFIAKAGNQVTYIEQNEELCLLNIYNFKELGLPINVIHNTAEKYLAKCSKTFDTVYIDPSRRVDGNKKTGVHNLLPNVVELQSQLLKLAPHIVIKLSPMQDISELVQELKFVSEIHVVSVKEDVKELLVILERSYTKQPKLTVTSLLSQNSKNQKGELWKLSTPLSSRLIKCNEGTLGKYIYQPHPAIVKAALHDYEAVKLNLTKIHTNTQLYTSDTLDRNYKGKIFEVLTQTPLQKKVIAKYLPEKKANIISKNHPLSPAQIAKKIGFKEGGDLFLIACTNSENRKICLVCKRL